MKRKAQAKVDFIDEIPAKKIEKSLIIYGKIVAAVDPFATPDVPMDTFKTDILDFDTLVKAVEGGDHSKIEARDAAEKVVDEDLRALAKYVSRIAKGSETIISLSGFAITKTDIQKPQPPAQAVINGNPGKIIGGLALVVDKLEFAIRYTFIVSEDLSGVSIVNGNVVVAGGAKPVVVRTTNLTKTTITELETRVTYQCMCFATSTAGAGKVSEVIIVKTF